MFCLNDSLCYYLCSRPIDMRGGFDRLCGIVRASMKRDPLSGEVFVFINKSRTLIKLLHWERGGLVLYQKRLERGCLSPPRLDPSSGSYRIAWSELVLMVEGISPDKVVQRRRYSV